jgi:hypothetical protein
MKATCATVLSLLLVLAQVLFTSPSASAANGSVPSVMTAEHACCDVPQVNCCACCVQRSDSRSVQLPALPPPVSSGPVLTGQLSAVLTALWTLPAAPAREVSPAAESSSAATVAVPLFLRHSVLLI